MAERAPSWPAKSSRLWGNRQMLNTNVLPPSELPWGCKNGKRPRIFPQTFRKRRFHHGRIHLRRVPQSGTPQARCSAPLANLFCREDMNQTMAALLSDLVCPTTGAVLPAFAGWSSKPSRPRAHPFRKRRRSSQCGPWYRANSGSSALPDWCGTGEKNPCDDP